MRRLICFVLMLSLLLPAGALGEETGDARARARALMEKMSAEEKVYQLFFVRPEDLTGEEYATVMPEENVFLRCPVGGVVLYGQNIVSEDQLRGLTVNLQAQAGAAGTLPLFLAVHEAGGLLSRVADKLGYPRAQGPAELARGGDADAAGTAGETIGAYLAPLGVNVDFAPPLDMPVNPEADVAARSLGDDPDSVAALGISMAAGLRKSGVIPCYGHFPNDGSLDRPNAAGRAVSKRTAQDMKKLEYIPYLRAVEAGADMIMLSSGVFRGMGDDLPASLSPSVIGALRQEIGFEGVVITEALNVHFIADQYSPGAAAVAALQAGADMLYLSPDVAAAAREVLKALEGGKLSWEKIDASLERILTLKIQYGIIR